MVGKISYGQAVSSMAAWWHTMLCCSPSPINSNKDTVTAECHVLSRHDCDVTAISRMEWDVTYAQCLHLCRVKDKMGKEKDECKQIIRKWSRSFLAVRYMQQHSFVGHNIEEIRTSISLPTFLRMCLDYRSLLLCLFLRDWSWDRRIRWGPWDEVQYHGLLCIEIHATCGRLGTLNVTERECVCVCERERERERVRERESE